GPLAGGLLLARFGYIGVFLVNGLSFLLSAVSECFIRFPKQIHHPSEKPAAAFFDNLKGGFQFLWQQPGLRLIIAGGIVLNFLMNPIFSVVLPYLGKELMRMTPGQYSLSQIGFPLGMLLGTLIVSAVARRVRQYQMLTVGVRLHGFLLLPLSLLSIPLVWTRFSPWMLPLLLAIPLFLTGIVNVQINVPLNVMMQQTVPDHYRGRVFSLFGSLLNMAAPVGMALFGILTDTIPVYFLLIFCGLVIAAMASVLARPVLRDMCQENEQRELRHATDPVISQ
ncbi:MAG: MFS transporter, partial [Eubacteriales bacterium]|nr:MFS transporter [Eubacteriales bacterium]